MDVRNAAYQLRFELRPTFHAHFSHGEFGLITGLDETGALISTEKWKNKKVGVAEFKKMYSGSLLVAEKDTASGEADYTERHRAKF